MASYTENFNLYPFPPPLPPTGNVELIRTEVIIPGPFPCCACKKAPGNLTCGSCKTVKYCSQECHKEHKDVCNTVEEDRVKVMAALVALSVEFGGTDALLNSPLVKEGGFKYSHPYITARWGLSQAYADCGKASSNCAAFRLAAENMMDIFWLTFSEFDPYEMYMRHKYCGWMVAGGLDQQALDFLLYFQQRLLSPHNVNPRHHLGSPRRLPDMDSSYHIEEDSFLNVSNGEKAMEWNPQDYMIIALIKYKGLQSLFASWNMFMMGTHSRVGEESTIQKIRGKTLVIEKLKGFVCDRLINQIKQILSTVNEKYQWIIPGLIDQSSIPESSDNGFHARQACQAHRAFDNYGYAWKMNKNYSQALQLFLDKGEVICEYIVAKDNM